MKITAASLPRPQVLPHFGLTTRVPDFIALMKPRVMFLAVFTAFVGMMLAPVHADPVLGSIAMLAIAVGAGAAGVLNMWYDADIDAVMTRTVAASDPSWQDFAGRGAGVRACSRLQRGHRPWHCINTAAAGLLAFTIFFYVVVYTLWLKRHTPQNIVIGGAAGALPPVVGWAAATGGVGLEPQFCSLSSSFGLRHISGRFHSTAQTSTSVQASPCCRSWPEGP